MGFYLLELTAGEHSTLDGDCIITRAGNQLCKTKHGTAVIHSPAYRVPQSHFRSGAPQAVVTEAPLAGTQRAGGRCPMAQKQVSERWCALNSNFHALYEIRTLTFFFLSFNPPRLCSALLQALRNAT